MSMSRSTRRSTSRSSCRHADEHRGHPHRARRQMSGHAVGTAGSRRFSDATHRPRLRDSRTEFAECGVSGREVPPGIAEPPVGAEFDRGHGAAAPPRLDRDPDGQGRPRGSKMQHRSRPDTTARSRLARGGEIQSRGACADDRWLLREQLSHRPVGNEDVSAHPRIVPRVAVGLGLGPAPAKPVGHLVAAPLDPDELPARRLESRPRPVPRRGHLRASHDHERAFDRWLGERIDDLDPQWRLGRGHVCAS
jgi:hypothetical protein